MANLMSDFSNKANGALSDFKNKVLNDEHQLEKIVHNAGEKIGSMASDFANSTADSMKSSRDYVKENPIKGVALAAAAGIVAGSLISAVLRSRKE